MVDVFFSQRLCFTVKCLTAVLIWLLVLAVVIPQEPQAHVSGRRKLQINDVLNLQQIGRAFGGPIAFSPNGLSLALVIQRHQLTQNFSAWSLLGNDRSDIYLIETNSPTPINLTNGIIDQAGYWAPSWSPDGSRLAMLSTRNGNVYMWVWERETRKLRQVLTRPVDLYSVVDRPYVWVSPSSLLVNVLPAGDKTSQMMDGMRVAEKTSREWAKMRSGTEVSASVLSSGNTTDVQTRSNHQLLGVNIDEGKSWVVSADAPRKVTVSPDKTKVAFVTRIDTYKFDPAKPLPYEDWEGKFELHVISMQGSQLLSHDAASKDVIPTSIRWSPDGRELVFLSFLNGTTQRPLLTRFRPESPKATPLPTVQVDGFLGGRTPPQLEWTSKGWLIYGSKADHTSSPTRYDWWVIEQSSATRCVTCSMKMPPAKLLPEVNHKTFVGLADRNLWRISVDGSPLNITATFGKPISSIVWPQQEWRPDRMEMPNPGATYEEFIVGVKRNNITEFFSIELALNKLAEIVKPSPSANIIARAPQSNTTLFSSYDADGLRIWLSSANTPLHQIFEANQFLREISSGTQRNIEYRSNDGQPLAGWLMLPPDYVPGKKYPLIVYVYPIRYVRPFDSISDAIYLNLQIAAARGYVVLSPTVPFTVEGPTDNPLLKLTSGVLPGVDKAIELGIADRNRLFVMGHSLGGFATYGLITQTNRFKAAVALGGLTNLVSGYGQFDTASRYDDYPNQKSSNQALVIESVLSLRLPPWDDMERYLRNSPTTYVSRVQTPLMIIQGDLDGIPIEQGEEFFMALQRQGKRAEFVRYWGEGHVFQSPANIRDVWERIFAWFKEFDEQSD